MPLAYRNGRFLAADELHIPYWDAGFIQGVTVAEQLRTFGGKLFRLADHLQRLRHSLEIVGIDLGEEFARLALLPRNWQLTTIDCLSRAMI